MKPSLAQEQYSYYKPFSYWLSRHTYYYSHVFSFYHSMIGDDNSVLHVSSKNGYLFEKLGSKHGVGIEENDLEREQAPLHENRYHYYRSLQELPAQRFDYIVLSFSTMEAEDIQLLFQDLKAYCHEETRIIQEYYMSWWAPILWITQKLGWRRKTNFKNWLSRQDITNFAYLAGYEIVSSGGYILCPLYIPIVSWLLNDYIAHLSLINRLCLHQWMVLRTVPEKRAPELVSIIIPCRNEQGNVEPAVLRTPQLGKNMEIIFVEGNSTDGTRDEIKRVVELYADKNIRWYIQDGKGKGNAMRKGFDEARGDIIMILDGDLTMPPEELPKFYAAIVSGKGDFINGSRLVYGMESGEMTFLAWLSNKFFARLITWIINQPITDSLCGTKVFWRKDYQRIAQQRQTLGLHDPFGDFDLLFGAAKLNLKIADIPIHYKRRTYGQTSINKYKELWFLLWMCWRAFTVIKRKNEAKN